MHSLVEKFQEYSVWRFTLTRSVEQYRYWLIKNRLSSPEIEIRLKAILSRVADDRLSIAFVAEFSRGKSELINAIFFADYGQRILPSSAGRTTMCPTELMYDATLPPSLRLLPIETRAFHGTTADYKTLPREWQILPLDTRRGEGMLAALKQVSLVKRVPVEEARSYGLYDETDPDQLSTVDPDGTIEISRWRHAIINFPHPLLEQGLVILDTPGLNAIGNEPELTLNLIPNAHAVLFILAADTGVTKTDIEIWRKHIGGSRKQGRIAVLNKIDSMWDELKSPEEVEAEIQKQLDSCAKTLALEKHQIFAVSAQKGLLAKVHRDNELLAKSRLPELERALSVELIPQKQAIVRDIVAQEIASLIRGTQASFATRTLGLNKQFNELTRLRGKNSSVIDHMMLRVRAEKDEFDRNLAQFQVTRAVFSKLARGIFVELSLSRLRNEVRATREAMASAAFSLGLRAAMEKFFLYARGALGRSQAKSEDVCSMVQMMYRKMAEQNAWAPAPPIKFSLDRYLHEIERVEAIYQDRFGLLRIVSTDQLVLTRKFFESIASRVKESFEAANRDAEAWVKAIFAPLEGQLGEHQSQLQRRLESIKQVQNSTDALELQIGEVDMQRGILKKLSQQLNEIEQTVEWTLHASIDTEQGALIL